MWDTIYQLLWLFTIYACLGWCCEVVFAAACTGEFVNRGFLNGPVCPIYGFGVLLVVYALEPVKHNVVLLFVGSVVLTSVLEWMTGFLLEKLFHDKWWDYSQEPFNISGYICLKFSLLWGVACVLVVDVIHPGVMHFVGWLPHTLGVVLILLIVVLFLADASVTAAAILHLKKRLRLAREIAGELRHLSNQMGENLAEGVLKGKGAAAKQRERIETMAAAYQKLSDRNRFGQKRILRAFPKLQKPEYKGLLDKLKHQLNGKDRT